MHTENAYIVHDQQENDDVILPLTSQKETFKTYVADNIDRKEETLSGKRICLNQFLDQRFIFYLFIYLFIYLLLKKKVLQQSNGKVSIL